MQTPPQAQTSGRVWCCFFKMTHVEQREGLAALAISRIEIAGSHPKAQAKLVDSGANWVTLGWREPVKEDEAVAWFTWAMDDAFWSDTEVWMCPPAPVGGTASGSAGAPLPPPPPAPTEIAADVPPPPLWNSQVLAVPARAAWPVPMDALTQKCINEMLGKGPRGRAYHGEFLSPPLTGHLGLLDFWVYPTRHVTSNTPVLMHVFRRSVDDRDRCKLAGEVAVLREVGGHPNVVRLLDVCSVGSAQRIAFVFPHLSGLHTPHWQAFGVEGYAVGAITGQIFNGLAHVHSLSILHGDLKAENILVHAAPDFTFQRPPAVAKAARARWVCPLSVPDDVSPCTPPADAESLAATARWVRRLRADVVLKLSGFGLATNVNSAVRGQPPHELGDLENCCPEVLCGETWVTQDADIWSVGCLMAKLTVGQTHWQGDSPRSQISKIFATKGTPADGPLTKLPLFESFAVPRRRPLGWGPQFHDILGEHGVAFLDACTALAPTNRILADQAKKHRFFDQLSRVQLGDKPSCPSWVGEGPCQIQVGHLDPEVLEYLRRDPFFDFPRRRSCEHPQRAADAAGGRALKAAGAESE